MALPKSTPYQKPAVVGRPHSKNVPTGKGNAPKIPASGAAGPSSHNPKLGKP